MKKFLILIVLMLLVGCSSYEYKKVEVNGKVYKCTDLEEGIYKDARGKKYKLNYNLTNGNLNIYFTEK